MTDDEKIELRDRLKAILDERDFIVGVLSNTKQENWPVLLDILRDHPEYDSDRVSLIALALKEVRDCPLMGGAIDDGTCYDIHMVVEGIAPLWTAPKKVQENEQRVEICESCPHHRTD